MGFVTGTRKVGKNIVYDLIDDRAGCTASILPSFGFNLFDLRLPIDGKIRPVIYSAPDFAENPRGGAGNGIPVLFPFPNRIRDGRFTFDGVAYQIPPNSGPNAIHGFAAEAAWDVLEHGADKDGAKIVGRYHLSKNSPEAVDHWPADAILTLEYRLKGLVLTLSITVNNPTAKPLPYGLGFHPYFRLPFDKGSDLAKTAVILPASKYWPLVDFLPTGEIKAVDPRLDFRKGQPIQGLKLDDVLTGLPGRRDQVARLVDWNLKSEVRVGFDENFRELVVYTPPDKPDVISIEPYTQTTDAINLQARGIDAGLRVLKHGETQRMTLSIEAHNGLRP